MGAKGKGLGVFIRMWGVSFATAVVVTAAVLFVSECMRGMREGELLSPQEGTRGVWALVLLCLAISLLVSLLGCKLQAVHERRRKSVRLWQLQRPEEAFVALGSFPAEEPGEGDEVRYAVGVGPLRALPYVVSSLCDAYGAQFNWRNILHAHEAAADRFVMEEARDAILIGSGAANPQTAEVLRLISKRLELVRMDGRGIVLREPQSRVERTFAAAGGDMAGDGAAPRADVGLVVNCRQGGRRVVILAGCSAYGTGAVARYFCTELAEERAWKRRRGGDYAAVVQVEFNAWPPVPTVCRLMAFYELGTSQNPT